MEENKGDRKQRHHGSFSNDREREDGYSVNHSQEHLMSRLSLSQDKSYSGSSVLRSESWAGEESAHPLPPEEEKTEGETHGSPTLLRTKRRGWRDRYDWQDKKTSSTEARDYSSSKHSGLATRSLKDRGDDRKVLPRHGEKKADTLPIRRHLPAEDEVDRSGQIDFPMLRKHVKGNKTPRGEAKKTNEDSEYMSVDQSGARMSVSGHGESYRLPPGTDPWSVTAVDKQGQLMELSVDAEEPGREAEVQVLDKRWTGKLIECTDKACLLEVTHPGDRKEIVKVVDYKYVKWLEPKERLTTIHIHPSTASEEKQEDYDTREKSTSFTILFATCKLSWQPRVDIVVFFGSTESGSTHGSERSTRNRNLMRLTLSAWVHNRGRVPIKASHVEYKMGHAFIRSRGGSGSSSSISKEEGRKAVRHKRVKDILTAADPHEIRPISYEGGEAVPYKSREKGAEEVVFHRGARVFRPKSLTTVKLVEGNTRAEKIYVTSVVRNVVYSAFEVAMPFTMPATWANVTDENGSFLGRSYLHPTSRLERTFIRLGRTSVIRAEHVREEYRETSTPSKQGRHRLAGSHQKTTKEEQEEATRGRSSRHDRRMVRFVSTVVVGELGADDEPSIRVLIQIPMDLLGDPYGGSMATPASHALVKIYDVGRPESRQGSGGGGSGLRRSKIQEPHRLESRVHTVHEKYFYQIVLRPHQRAVCECRFLPHTS